MASRKGARGKRLRNRAKTSLFRSTAPSESSGSDHGVISCGPKAPRPTTVFGVSSRDEAEIIDADEYYIVESNEPDMQRLKKADGARWIGDFGNIESLVSSSRNSSGPCPYDREQLDVRYVQEAVRACPKDVDEDDEEILFSGRNISQFDPRGSALFSSSEILRNARLTIPPMSPDSCLDPPELLARELDDNLIESENFEPALNSEHLGFSPSLDSQGKFFAKSRVPKSERAEVHGSEMIVHSMEDAQAASQDVDAHIPYFGLESGHSESSDNSITSQVAAGHDFEAALDAEENCCDMDGLADESFLSEMTKYVHRDTLSLENLGKADPLKLSDNFEPSDDELMAKMHASWHKDRQKKALRKQARAELHRAGEFNQAKRIKPKSLGLDEIITEIDALVTSEQSMLELPPIPKAQRKMVHEIARAYGLTSKSVGHGLARHPCLHKRLRSRAPDDFDAELFRRRTKQSKGRRQFNAATSSSLTAETRRFHKASRGGAAQYLEGEVVGAAAPGLDANNRGHAMLEKMGWNAGSPLGKEDNQGLLNPIWHVVKSSRAGLG